MPNLKMFQLGFLSRRIFRWKIKCERHGNIGQDIDALLLLTRFSDMVCAHKYVRTDDYLLKLVTP